MHLDEPSRDAELVSRFPQTALEHRVHLEAGADVGNVEALRFRLKRRGASGHAQRVAA